MPASTSNRTGRRAGLGAIRVAVPVMGVALSVLLTGCGGSTSETSAKGDDAGPTASASASATATDSTSPSIDPTEPSTTAAVPYSQQAKITDSSVPTNGKADAYGKHVFVIVENPSDRWGQNIEVTFTATDVKTGKPFMASGKVQSQTTSVDLAPGQRAVLDAGKWEPEDATGQPANIPAGVSVKVKVTPGADATSDDFAATDPLADDLRNITVKWTAQPTLKHDGLAKPGPNSLADYNGYVDFLLPPKSGLPQGGFVPGVDGQVVCWHGSKIVGATAPSTETPGDYAEKVSASGVTVERVIKTTAKPTQCQFLVTSDDRDEG